MHRFSPFCLFFDCVVAGLPRQFYTPSKFLSLSFPLSKQTHIHAHNRRSLFSLSSRTTHTLPANPDPTHHIDPSRPFQPIETRPPTPKRRQQPPTHILKIHTVTHIQLRQRRHLVDAIEAITSRSPQSGGVVDCLYVCLCVFFSLSVCVCVWGGLSLVVEHVSERPVATII